MSATTNLIAVVANDCARRITGTLGYDERRADELRAALMKAICRYLEDAGRDIAYTESLQPTGRQGGGGR